MQCKRLVGLVKDWYLRVQEETMAPARMMVFVEQHIERCEECQEDPDVREEVKRIKEIVLPPSRVPKVSRPKTDDMDDDEDIVETDDDEDIVETDDDDDDDDDIEVDLDD